jgi:tetratricopeptide (TPR) repeat protein
MLTAVITQVFAQPQSSQTQSPEVLFKEADSAYERGDIEQAIRLYEKLVKVQPDSIAARANLGAAFAHVGRYEDAVVQYKEALKRDPGNPGVMLNLALARYKQAAFDKAAAEFEQLRAKHPESQQSLYLLADCYLRLGRNHDAIALLRPFYDAGPEDRAVEFALGMALLRDGQISRAESMIDRVLKSGSSAEADLLMGAAQLAAGDAQTATPTLHKALEADPSLPGGWSLYGRALLDSGEPEGARTALQKALEADANDFEANLYLGGMLRHDGSLEEATPYLEKALLLRPASVEARFQVGMLNLAEGHIEEARKHLEQVERESPDFQEAHAQLAVLYARLNRKEDSERERNLVLKLNELAREKGTHK